MFYNFYWECNQQKRTCKLENAWKIIIYRQHYLIARPSLENQVLRRPWPCDKGNIREAVRRFERYLPKDTRACAARALRRIEKVMELKVRDWYLEK